MQKIHFVREFIFGLPIRKPMLKSHFCEI